MLNKAHVTSNPVDFLSIITEAHHTGQIIFESLHRQPDNSIWSQTNGTGPQRFHKDLFIILIFFYECSRLTLLWQYFGTLNILTIS